MYIIFGICCFDISSYTVSTTMRPINLLVLLLPLPSLPRSETTLDTLERIAILKWFDPIIRYFTMKHKQAIFESAFNKITFWWIKVIINYFLSCSLITTTTFLYYFFLPLSLLLSAFFFYCYYYTFLSLSLSYYFVCPFSSFSNFIRYFYYYYYYTVLPHTVDF